MCIVTGGATDVGNGGVTEMSHFELTFVVVINTLNLEEPYVVNYIELDGSNVALQNISLSYREETSEFVVFGGCTGMISI